MDGTIIDLLNDKIDKVDRRVEKIDEKVDKLLAFKWQIIGGSVLMSAIIGIFLQIALAVIK